MNDFATRELSNWLDQLHDLSEKLDLVRPMATSDVVRNQQQEDDDGLMQQQAPPFVTSTSLKLKPAVPPKPQIDSYRYSMANMEESADVDLDVLLDELCALESQLNAGGVQQQQNDDATRCLNMSTKISLSNGGASNPTSWNPSKSACKMDKYSFDGQPSLAKLATDFNCRSHSPDNDSAFCDNVSVMSAESVLSINGHRSRDSNGSSADSTRGSMTTPSPTQLMESVQAKIKVVHEEIVKNENLTDDERNARLKTEKIKIALEKMKEASVRKIYVKIFSLDGSSKSVLVDERWTVGYVLRQIAEKNHVVLTPRHALVECYADLNMERIYEDHEHLVENILLWSRESSNKLFFVERREKYDVFYNPQNYLVADERKQTLNVTAKRHLLEEFFSFAHVQPPEVEGVLHLKIEGKKAWRRHHFVLRSSGLYYVPKGKTKASKDLVCLTQLDMVQVYNAIGWRKKYKAPTDWGFALKYPQIQVKASRYIKYLCADDDSTLNRWLTGLRLAKNGRQLYDNFEALQTYSDEAEEVNAKSSINVAPTVDYNKQSVVIRPKYTHQSKSECAAAVAKLATELSTDPSAKIGNSSSNNHRPKSADIVRSKSVCSGGKRGSRALLQVTGPAIPIGDDFCSPTISRRNAPHESKAAQDNFMLTSSMSESHSASNGFEADSTLVSTIKKQPFACKTPVGAAHLPLTESTRQIHSRIFDNQRDVHASCVSVNSSKGSTEEENDSDEELPPPPAESGDDNSSLAFPPPPSPLPMELCAEVDVAQNVEGRKRPPPPPKRSETTKLSTVNDSVSKVVVKESVKAPPTSTTNAFHDELQLAMSRRLKQMHSLEEESKNAKPLPLPPKKPFTNQLH